MNLADESQVKKKTGDFNRKREIELLELKKILEQKPVRDYLWRILEKCGVFRSIWEQSARIHYNSGQQDLGHYLMAEIQEADGEKLFQMMRENKQKQEEILNA